MKESKRLLLVLGAIHFSACDRATKVTPVAEQAEAAPPSIEKTAPLENLAPPEKPAAATPSAEAAPERRSEWSRCYQGFKSSGDPSRDALRLGLMCGPVTGMQAAGPAFQGKLSGSGAVTEVFSLNKECIRVVAASNGAVADLELELFAPDGRSLALSNLGQAWTLLPPDEPLCVEEAGWYRITLGTHGGDGEYALRILHRWPSGEQAASSPRSGPAPSQTAP